jgi:DNA-binding protein H-NS
MEKIDNNVDIKGLSVEELKALKVNIEVELETKTKQHYEENVAHVVDLIKENKIPIIELLNILAAKKALFKADIDNSTMLPEKVYYNPDLPIQTYSGRGKRPKWVVDLTKEGKDYKDYVWYL